jgi:hypothetical protein
LLSGRERWVETAGVAAVLAVAALLAVSPHVLVGFSTGHSVNVNIFWHDSFSEQLLSGELLPRWSFNYWGCLGAPVFYLAAFYVLARRASSAPTHRPASSFSSFPRAGTR